MNLCRSETFVYCSSLYYFNFKYTFAVNYYMLVETFSKIFICLYLECKINGQIATEDRDVTSDDPCLKCRCSPRGMTCSKKACPVLQCSERRQYHPPGECCPRCTGTRTLMTVPQTCTLQSSFQREGHTFNIDRCTNCTCLNETSVCRRNSCPVLECSPELQVKVPGSCCKKCTMPEEVRSQCSYGGKVYEASVAYFL